MSDFSTDIEEARHGDAGALRRLYDDYFPAIRARIQRHLNLTLRRHYDTLDLSQSVFLELVRDLPRFRDLGEKSFRNWLSIKAVNKVRMKFRKHLRPGGLRREITMHDGAAEALRESLGVSSPVLTALRTEEVEGIRTALGSLNGKYRRVLLLRGGQQLPYSDVAEQMTLPSADAAKKLYARALLRLRSAWKNHSRTPS